MLTRNTHSEQEQTHQSAKLPTPSQNLHAIAQVAHVRPSEAYRVHGGFPPTPEQIAAAKNAPTAKAAPRTAPQQLYIKRQRPSWWMRHIWPLFAVFTPMRYAVRNRRQYVRDLDWLARNGGEPCTPDFLQ